MASAQSVQGIFGTDGVRGKAGEVVTTELAAALGSAAGAVLARPGGRALLVRDTRESGPGLEQALAGGIAVRGIDVYSAGVLPTPAAAVLLTKYDFDFAAVISASHNPYYDNGIKFFAAGGQKLSDEQQSKIEQRLSEGVGDGDVQAGSINELLDSERDYVRALEEYFSDLDLSGKRILLDCANGASVNVAPAVFTALGADVGVIGSEPDGKNINEEVGSTHPERLQEMVLKTGAEIGFAFDGDADRVLAITPAGEVVDGDELLALLAESLCGSSQLGGGVAVTIMTNLGFHKRMEQLGVETAVTKVGDRYVSDELERRGWSIGGEQSGHIINRGFCPTGDGIAAALLVMRALALDGGKLRSSYFKRLPQQSAGVVVADKSVAESPSIQELLETEQRHLGDSGRIVLRPSGTEPLIRVMVEAPTEGQCSAVLGRMVEAVEQSNTATGVE